MSRQDDEIKELKAEIKKVNERVDRVSNNRYMQEKIDKLEKILEGGYVTSRYLGEKDIYTQGLIKELDKLRAIVNEVVDYVYREEEIDGK